MVTLRYSSLAQAKISLLLQNFHHMVGWHGTIARDGDVYVLDDILVYPQICTLATCSADHDRYAVFLMKLTEDEFNRLRYHGCTYLSHHILTPSTTNLTFEEELCAKLPEGDAYFFEITNERQERNVRMRTKDDVVEDVQLSFVANQCMPFNVETFLEDAKQKIQMLDISHWHPFEK